MYCNPGVPGINSGARFPPTTAARHNTINCRCIELQVGLGVHGIPAFEQPPHTSDSDLGFRALYYKFGDFTGTWNASSPGLMKS